MPPAASVPAVSVVPMPRRLVSVNDLVKTASLASSIASRSGRPLVIAARRASSAVALATSPARCPPMPSATATSPIASSTR